MPRLLLNSGLSVSVNRPEPEYASRRYLMRPPAGMHRPYTKLVNGPRIELLFWKKLLA